MASSLKARLEKKVRQKIARPIKKRARKKQPFRGKWEMWSDTDSRWNSEGTSEIGGDRRPEEIEAKIDELKQKLGNPPDDINWTYRLE